MGPVSALREARPTCMKSLAAIGWRLSLLEGQALASLSEAGGGGGVPHALAVWLPTAAT